MGIFLFITVPRTALGPTQPPIQSGPVALSLGLKWPGGEADHSPPSSAEVKNAWSYTSTPPICLHGVALCWSIGTICTWFHPFVSAWISLLHPHVVGIRQSVKRWATGWTIGVLGFDFRRGLGIFLFTTASRTAVDPTQPPIHWVPGVLSLGVKRPGRDVDHSPPSSAEVKESAELCFQSPIRLHGVVLS
jgi:hypothetical protein